MAYVIPTIEPLEFLSGDTVKWTKTLAEFPATEGWTLTYYLKGAGSSSVVATTSGPDYAVTISAATTAALTVGDYWLNGYVTKSGERYIVYENKLKVKKDQAVASSGYDNRTHTKICLDAIQSVLEGRATRADQSYQIMGRSVSHYSFKELIEMEDRYLALYELELEDDLIARGEPTGKNIMVKFNKTS